MRIRSDKNHFFILLTLLLIPLSAGQNFNSSAAALKQKGISYACWWSGLYSSSDSDISLDNLAQTGANWISLIVTGYQDSLRSAKIYRNTATPTDDDLIHVVNRAHSLGLMVMLKPHVDLWSDPSHWRGQIGNAFKTEAEWDAWFSSYRDFINHYADLAQASGADQFCAGTELEGTSHRAGDWRNIVAGVRSRFHGPIVYAANHDGEEISLSWWDAVDYIGIDAYYPISNKKDPTVTELKASWAPRITALANLVSRWQKPIIFTEIGYRSIDGTAIHPWDWQIQGAIDLKEQADAYQAVVESFGNRPWFAGIYWWSWGTDPSEGGPRDDGYTPYDKPAEDVLRAWFGEPQHSRPGPPPEPNYSRIMDVYTDGLGAGWEDWSWGAKRNLFAIDQVYHGQYSISAKLGAWGALSFWHPAFAATPHYYWLEFFIRASDGNLPLLWAYFYDKNGNELSRRRVEDCRYIEGETIQAGTWNLVSIPLKHLGAAGKELSRICIQDRSGRAVSEFWIDDIRLVGATRRVGREMDRKKP